MASKGQAAARARADKAFAEREADDIAAFYNEGRGAKLVTDVEGETISEETRAFPDSSAADAAAEQTALAAVPIRYSVTDDDQLAKLRKEGENVSFDTPEGYEAGRKLIATLRALSGAVDRTRKIIKAPSIARGNLVDDMAKALTRQINEIREPLQAAKDIEDAAREKKRRAAEDAEREAIRAAEAAKLAAEREALEAQRRELAEAQALLAEAQQAARDAAAQLETDRQAVATDRERVTLAEAELARAAEPAPAPSAAPARYDWVSSSGPPLAAAPTLAPDSLAAGAGTGTDAGILHGFATELRALKSPAVKSVTAGAILEQVEFMLSEAIQALESYTDSEMQAAE